MKRISFKDSGGLHLTQAVLSGRKTMTRRAVPEWVERNAMVYAVSQGEDTRIKDYFRLKFAHILGQSPYKVGDVVAVKRAYRDIPLIRFCFSYHLSWLIRLAGWWNKIFAKEGFMPHHIRITDVRVEQLQDISDEDCLDEGIIAELDIFVEEKPIYSYTFSGCNSWYNTPRDAFAALIDKVSGYLIWNSNPLVWAYSFEMVD